MTKNAVRHVHASGKWSARPKTFAHYVAECVEQGNANRLTTTESRGMATAVHKALGKKRWDLERRGEFIVAVHRDHGELGNGWLARLSNEFAGPAAWRDPRCHWVNVRTDGGVDLVGAAHLNSGVQNGSNWSGFGGGVQAHQASTNRIGRTVRRQGDRDGEVYLAADCNLSLFLERWRDEMRRQTGMHGCWDDDQGKRGTHGPRLIDGVWSTEKADAARVLNVKRPGRIDHRALLAVYRDEGRKARGGGRR